MDSDAKPDLNLAQKVLPEPLYSSIKYLFQQDLFDTALVGGTALAGFYAGHRRSDDIDLFTKNESAQRSTILAVKSLTSIGAEKISEQESSHFYDSTWSLRSHSFTAQVVLDPGVFDVGSFAKTDQVVVASLETIFKMKAATLVSRCSEKDLYDLLWLFEEFPSYRLPDLIQSGFKIDGGVNAENMLASISGTALRAEACDFSIEKNISNKDIYAKILKFQNDLRVQLISYLKGQPTMELGKLVRYARRVLK